MQDTDELQWLTECHFLYWEKSVNQIEHEVPLISSGTSKSSMLTTVCGNRSLLLQ